MSDTLEAMVLLAKLIVVDSGSQFESVEDDWPPFVLITGGPDSPPAAVDLIPYMTDEMKDNTLGILLPLLAQASYAMVIIVAGFALDVADLAEEYVSPEHHPRRREVVNVLGADSEGQRIVIHMEVFYDEGGVRRPGEWIERDDALHEGPLYDVLGHVGRRM